MLCYSLLIFVTLTFYGAVPISAFLADLTLKDLSNSHATVGEDVILECSIKSQTDDVKFIWNAPINMNLTTDRVNISERVEKTDSSVFKVTSRYVIYNATLRDSSIYYCRVVEKNTNYTKSKYIWVQLYDVHEHALEFHKKGITFDAANLELSIPIRAHPNLTVSVNDKNNGSFSTANFTLHKKQCTTFTNYIIVLKFNTLSRDDLSNYTVVVDNGFETKSLEVPVNVSGVPVTTITADYIDNENLTAVLKCNAVGFPKPTIKWYLYACNSFSCFKNDTPTSGIEVKGFKEEDYGLEVVSYIALNSSDFGFLECVAENSFGKKKTLKRIFDVGSDFEIFTEHVLQINNVSAVDVLYNEAIAIMCGISLSSYQNEIVWYRENESRSLDDPRIPTKGYQEFKIKNYDSVFGSISKFNVDVRNNLDAGRYTCMAFKNDGSVEYRSLLVRVREQQNINIDSNMQNKTVDVEIDKPWKFYCNPDAFPTPVVHWFKDNKTIQSSPRIRITDNNHTLSFTSVQQDDEGEYACRVSNRLNSEKIKSVRLIPFETHLQGLFIALGVLLIALVVVCGFVIYKVRKDRKFKEELYLAGLTHFQDGALEYLNPKMRLNDQANLLPYDTKWEIPIENIKLGQELGSGAFGVVLKAEISGLTTDSTTVTAAVKMIDKFAGFLCVKALASELKILVHMGKHLNIVNLIGACTKDVAKRKLLVVVEYCPFGNLQDYILSNSKNFIDQRNVEKEEFEWPPEVKNDESKTPTNICSRDLLIWGFQITQGMEYLASRRVLHGDLAARNVLLAEGNVVKISDFGLSKNIYKDGIYKKKENVPLPVKWMAIESIGQKIFSTQSDVWSFGIVLWELFSLGRTPYPGMQVDETFYEKLVNGYRMESPEFSTKKIHELMLSCWNFDPMLRPSFTDLAEKIGHLLEERVKNHYLDMNKAMGGKKSDEDYLLMMSPPNYENIISSLSRYVNFTKFGCKNIAFDTDKTDNSKK